MTTTNFNAFHIGDQDLIRRLVEEATGRHGEGLTFAQLAAHIDTSMPCAGDNRKRHIRGGCAMVLGWA